MGFTKLLLHGDGSDAATFVPDTSGENCKLMLHFDGVDQAVATTDAATNKAVTFVGTAQLDTAQSKFGGSSLLLDGNSDYVSLVDSADFNFGTGNWTIECQLRFAADPQGVWNGLYGQNVDPTHFISISIFNGTVYFYVIDGSVIMYGYSLEASPPFTDATTWYHLAVVRYGTAQNNIAIYVNGVSQTMAWSNNLAADASFPDIAAIATIGYDGYRNQYFNGHIDDFRIIKGKALYTANFTAPTVSPSPKDVLCVGNAQIDTAQKEFGTGSILFDGTGDYLSLADSDDWNFGTGDFTIDFWVRFVTDPDAGPYRVGFVGQHVDAGHEWAIRTEFNGHLWFEAFDTENSIQMQIFTNGDFFTAADTWYHVAIVRYGTGVNNLAMYLNGVSQVLTFDYPMGANEAFPNIASALTIGDVVQYAGTHYYLDGWIDEFRISKGVARWTANFTPPTSAYPDYGVKAYTQDFLDSIATSDVKTTQRGITLNLLDSMSSSDSKTQRLAFGQTYLDSVSLTDLISMAKEYELDLIDGMSLSDYLERVARLSQAFPDAITLQDIFNRVLVGTRNFLDTTVMSDAIYKDLTKSFKDEVLLSDAITLLKKLNKLFEDSVTLTDRIDKLMGKPFQDMITLTDILSRVAVLSVSPKDIITLNEKEFSIIYTNRDVIEISANPQIQSGTHGQFLSLQYVTDYPKLRWVDGRGLKLFKGKDFTMNSGSIINFIYDSANSVWNETSRMQNIGVIDGEG